MNREQFISYAHEVTSPEAIEPIHERIAEHNGEVSAFGDSWPGAIPQLRASVSQVRRIEATLARLEGREPRDFHFAYIRHPA